MEIKIKNSSPYISLKIIPKHGKVISVASRKTKRIFYIVKAENFSDCIFKVSVRYKPGISNSGEYNSKKDLLSALKAFLELE